MHTVIAVFRAYFDHVRSLGFEDRPDYEYLRRLFRELFLRKGYSYDCQFDWSPSIAGTGSLSVSVNVAEQGVGTDSSHYDTSVSVTPNIDGVRNDTHVHGDGDDDNSDTNEIDAVTRDDSENE